MKKFVFNNLKWRKIMENNLFKNIKLFKNKSKNCRLIPIFFATDDNYIPFLEVAMRSLIENASKDNNYIIHILNTGLLEENKKAIENLANENFQISFEDISDCIAPIKSKLKNVYHFSLITYYRLFIEKLFPQYDKVLYLDCDIVVLGDIAKLYNTNLCGNLVGAIPDQIINNNATFSEYAVCGVGVVPEKYFNAGILVMNLKKFRQEKICEQFMYLINTYNFDVVDPDQAYLNALCKDKVKYLPNGWNKEPLPNKVEGGLNIVHYALYKKPWQYDDVLNGEYFWSYAEKCTMFDKILKIKNSFTEEKRKAKESANVEIVDHAVKIINDQKNMCNVLFGVDNVFGDLMSKLEAFDFDLCRKVEA